MRELIVDMVARLPQGAISRAWGWLARRRRPRMAVELLKRGFVQATGIDMAEAARPLEQYSTLEELFVRELRAGVRRVDPDPAAIVSPVDGRVGSVGSIEAGELLQVKGRPYRVGALLGDEADAERYEGGSYATLYLCPRDYHRIHAPLAGQVVESVHIPGRLLPVFSEACQRIEELFCRNERIITYLDTAEAGRLALVKVGATLVGRILVSYDPNVTTNAASKRDMERRYYDPPHTLVKGAELGAFALGSTVVLLAERDAIRLDPIRTGDLVRVGERLGKVLQRTRRRRKRSRSSPAQPGM